MSTQVTSAFKIRHVKTGLYSTGRPHVMGWSSVGVAWASMGTLRAYLNRLRKSPCWHVERADASNWEIVCCSEASVEPAFQEL